MSLRQLPPTLAPERLCRGSTSPLTHVCCCSAIFVSFGGLLMKLKGEPQHLSKLVLDSRIYLLMRKARDD